MRWKRLLGVDGLRYAPKHSAIMTTFTQWEFQSKTPEKESRLKIASESLNHFSPQSRMAPGSACRWRKNLSREMAELLPFPRPQPWVPQSILRCLVQSRMPNAIRHE